MNLATDKIGDVGYFSVIVEHDDRDQSIRFIQGLAAKLRDSKYVRSVLYDYPIDFLRENFFLLAPLDKLEALKTGLAERKRRANPFYIDLETPDADSPSRDSHGEEELAEAKRHYQDLTERERFHVSSNIAAMQIRPRQAVTNISFISEMYEHLVTTAIDFRDDGGFSPTMQIFVSGSMRNKLEEYRAVINDVRTSVLASGAMILAILLLFFRNPIPILLIATPLGAGLIWSFAIVSVTIGFLNVITATLLMVLFGLGIDHGIHLLRRFTLVASTKPNREAAILATMSTTGRATLISALTTGGGFVVLVFTDFRGFSHLGFISAVAMLLTIVAYFAMMPALLTLIPSTKALEPLCWQRGLFVERFWRRFFSICATIPRTLVRPLYLGLMIGGVAAASSLSFNYNFSTLMAKVPSHEHIKKKMGQVYKDSLTPGAVFFAKDDASLSAIITELKRRRKDDPETPTIGRIASIRDYLPANQPARLEAVRDSAKMVTRAVLKKAAKDDAELVPILKHLRASRRLGQIAYEDLPAAVADFFTMQDGSGDHAVFVFPSIERKEGEKAIQFKADMAPITIAGVNHYAAGATLILASMLEVVIEQGVAVFVMSLVAIYMLLLVQLGSFRRALPPFATLLMGLSVFAIALKAMGTDINFYNMAIFAAVVGMGVDVAIHLYEHWLTRVAGENHSAAADANAGFLEVAPPITASTATTLAGYLGMVGSSHPGVASIGILAVTGLSACYLAAMVLFPLLLRRSDQL